MRKPFVVGAALALVLSGSLLTACGDDDDGSVTSSGSGSGSASGSGSGSASAPAEEPPVSLPGTVNDHGSGEVEDGGGLEMELDDQYFALVRHGHIGVEVRIGTVDRVEIGVRQFHGADLALLQPGTRLGDRELGQFAHL